MITRIRSFKYIATSGNIVEFFKKTPVWNIPGVNLKQVILKLMVVGFFLFVFFTLQQMLKEFKSNEICEMEP